jgi:hypothetical protein
MPTVRYVRSTSISLKNPVLRRARCAGAGAASEAKRRLFASQGEGRLREGDEFRQFPQILGGGGQ